MLFQATKSTWVTRRIPVDLDVSWLPVDAPVVGDVLACEVLVASLHGRVETADGSRARLYPGDRIACVVGNRYATSMLQAFGLVGGELVDLLSASGLCGEVVGRADKVAKPTRLRVLAQGHDRDRPLSVRRFSLPSPRFSCEPVWVVVVGSAMDSGKTTACSSIIHGLRAAGARVGAAKLSGTASARDVGSYRDAGASPVFDFLDAGWPSTAGCTDSELRDIAVGLVGHLRASDVQFGVLEIADGLLQRETDVLLGSLADWVGPARIVLTARESLAAVAGVAQLRRMGHEVLAVSGVVTSSPLACQEIELAGAGRCIRTDELGSQLASTLIGDRRPAAAMAASGRA